MNITRADFFCDRASPIVNRPRFWVVTGYDFARSIAWARRTENRVALQIRTARAATSANTKEGA